MLKKILLVAAAVLVCSAVAVAGMRGRSAREGALQQFAHAARERTVAPRFTVTARHTRCTVVDPAPGGALIPRESCGPDRDAPANIDDFKRGAESADPDSLHTSALANLIWWDQEELSLNDAIDRLEKARRLSRDTVPLLVDLSGAYLLRAERTQQSRDLMMGLNFASQVLALDTANLSALWNRALAVHAIGLIDEAAQAWDAYLSADSTSEWANEARDRKSRLRPAPVPEEPAPGDSVAKIVRFATEYPQEARVLGWGPVLGDWGKAVQEGDAARATVLLDFADTLGGALERREGGDQSLADAVRAIRAAHTDAAATASLARAHHAFANGYALFENVDNAAAAAAFDTAARARPSSAVLKQWTVLFRVLSQAYLSGRDRTVNDLRVLVAGIDTVHHPALAGRTHLSLATLLTNSAKIPEARPEYVAAAVHLRRAGEREFEALALSIRSEAEHLQGDTLQAYRTMHQALRVLREYPRSRSLQKHIVAFADRALDDRMPWAALSIADENVPLVTDLGIPIYEVDALQLRARAHALVGNAAGAARDLDSTVVRAGRLRSEEAQKEWARAVIWVANPGLVPTSTMDSAVAAFANHVVWLGPALMRRADARVAAGDLPGAMADLEAVTSGIRTLSHRQRNRALASAMLEQARGRFDRLVMLHVRANRPDEALRVLEQGRFSFTPTGDGGRPVDRTRLAVPPGRVALEYALIGDTLLIWTLRGQSLQLRQDTIDRNEFLLATEQTSAALESPARAVRATAGLRRLYDLLIRPVRDRLGEPETRLVILADGEIAGVPFAALQDSANGRYLIQDYSLHFAATLVDATRAASARGAVGPALLVANPGFEPESYPTYDPLRGAHEEVLSIRRFYPGSTLLERGQATRAAFTAQAQAASVIHYAGHAVFDDARPERSFLILAGDTAGRLTTQAVDTMDLHRVRLVVLSACRTLPSRGGRSGGFAGLSGALLSAGAGGVVGSLWLVGDQRTPPLMEAFHRAYTESGDAVDALRAAQLDMLRLNDPKLSSPATWAAFRYAGR